MKETLVLIFFISQVQCFSQLSVLNNREEDGLFDKPSKVIMSKFETVEKFGEPTDNLIELNEKTYNENGDYLTVHFENYKVSKKESTKYYYNPTGFLIKKDFEDNNFYKYSASYSYTGQNINQIFYKYLSNVSTETSKEEFIYDSENNKIEKISYDKNGNVLNIWKFLYRDRKVLEVKRFSKDGILQASTNYQYNSAGILFYQDNFWGGSRKIRSIDFNDRNDSVKVTSTFEVAKGYQPIRDINQYKYEYYPSGKVKKINCYYRDRRTQSDNLFRIIEYKSYDSSGNWIEKSISEQNYTRNKFMQLYRYSRQISYF